MYLEHMNVVEQGLFTNKIPQLLHITIQMQGLFSRMIWTLGVILQEEEELNQFGITCNSTSFGNLFLLRRATKDLLLASVDLRKTLVQVC